MWIVPCLEGATPTRTSGSSIYPAVQNMLLAARALGLGATLTTLYLQFEKEAEWPRSAYRQTSTHMLCCRSATRWDGLGRCAEPRSPMSSMKTSAAIRLTRICSGLPPFMIAAASNAGRKAAIYRMNPSM